jgi:hypothetical protein
MPTQAGRGLQPRPKRFSWLQQIPNIKDVIANPVPLRTESIDCKLGLPAEVRPEWSALD